MSELIVKRSVATRWVPIACAVALMATASLWLRGCLPGKGLKDPGTDQSIVLGEPFRTIHGLIIENGSAYDQSAVDIEQYEKLVVPENAVIRRAERGHRFEIFMKKTLGYHGHPDKPMSIRKDRKNMGCKVKVEGRSLVLAPYGEWDSRIEGGASVRMVLAVPEGIEIEKRAVPPRPFSIGGYTWNGEYLTKPAAAGGCYWRAPESEADGWKAVPDSPDATHEAEK